MANWLVKSELHSWSWQDQLSVEKEPWDGVRNFQAQKNMRSMAVGDNVLFYHSGKEKTVVGLCAVATAPDPDPDDDTSRFCLVDLSAVRSASTPATLTDIKKMQDLENIALVRQPRLSVMPLDDRAYDIICRIAGL